MPSHRRPVYTSEEDGASLSNLDRLSLASDNVFRDDSAATQMAAVASDGNGGWIATLDIALGG